MAEVIDPGFAKDMPAIRGVQAGREYYVVMCPLKFIPELLKVDENDISPELKAQRTINKSRVPTLAHYIVENRDSYLFSSLTASVDGNVEFTPISKSEDGQKMGSLRVSMDSKWLINDGQHRRAAIDLALKDDPSLGNETISIVIFLDRGLKRSQQMFADLNRFAVRPTKSLGILYDHRDPVSKLCQDLTKEVGVFRGKVEKAKSTISNRSQKLFTLSGIYQATRRLIGIEEGTEVPSEGKEMVVRFWNAVGNNMPDWLNAVKKEVSPKELRTDYVHAHGIALQALAIAGAALIAAHPDDWENRLVKIRTIDWARENSELWEGRAMIGGQINKSLNCQILTSNVIKKHLMLPLDSREQEAEDKYAKGKRKI
jgi:DNA sulfur modification protein DndB